MRTVAHFLLLLGAALIVLPMLDWHPAILKPFGQYGKYVPYAALAVGGILLALSFRKKKDEKK